MRNALAFLAELSVLVPPDVGNHALWISDGRLAVQVRHHRIGQQFYLDDVDLSRATIDVATEIAAIVHGSFTEEKTA